MKIRSLNLHYAGLKNSNWLNNEEPISGQSYKHFMLVNYSFRVVIWGIFQSGLTLES